MKLALKLTEILKIKNKKNAKCTRLGPKVPRGLKKSAECLIKIIIGRTAACEIYCGCTVIVKD